MLDYLTVTDLKNYAHCPRFTYYEHCLPDVRPRTYKMDEGSEEHERERERARRRTLRAYDLPAGERQFNVRVQCDTLRLRGEIDELVITPDGARMPIDYKLSRKVNESFALQLTAYAMLLESMHGTVVESGFIYLMTPRTMQPIPITAERRSAVQSAMIAARLIIAAERMPPPPKARAKCRDCEFRRFCNDVR
jgi:CRISPR-associated exonuclease Cas4